MCITIDNRDKMFTLNEIKNDELRTLANDLLLDAMNIRQNLIHMSITMATIANRGDEILSQFDGKIANFGEQVLGIKKSQTYSMVQVGNTFFDSYGTPRLIQSEDAKFSNTQYMALLPMAGKGKDKKSAEDTCKEINDLIIDGKISPSMTVKEIKETVKDYMNPNANTETSNKTETDTTETDVDASELAAKNILHVEGVKYGILATVQIAYSAQTDETIAVFNGENHRVVFGLETIQKLEEMLVSCTNYSDEIVSE